MCQESATIANASIELNDEQKLSAAAVFQQLEARVADEFRHLSELLASKDNAHLFGKTEFELRDRLHRLGSEILQAAAAERVKKGGLSRS